MDVVLFGGVWFGWGSVDEVSIEFPIVLVTCWKSGFPSEVSVSPLLADGRAVAPIWWQIQTQVQVPHKLELPAQAIGH